MADLAIIIAQTDAGLDQTAKTANCTILAGTRKSFTSLSTFDDHSLGQIGSISANSSGFLAIAMFN